MGSIRHVYVTPEITLEVLVEHRQIPQVEFADVGRLAKIPCSCTLVKKEAVLTFTDTDSALYDKTINRRSTTMNDTQPWEFTCKTCGDHGLTVAHTWSILAGVDSENWQEWGPLEASHHWHYDFK